MAKLTMKRNHCMWPVSRKRDGLYFQHLGERPCYNTRISYGCDSTVSGATVYDKLSRVPLFSATSTKKRVKITFFFSFLPLFVYVYVFIIIQKGRRATEVPDTEIQRGHFLLDKHTHVVTHTQLFFPSSVKQSYISADVRCNSRCYHCPVFVQSWRLFWELIKRLCWHLQNLFIFTDWWNGRRSGWLVGWLVSWWVGL